MCKIVSLSRFKSKKSGPRDTVKHRWVTTIKVNLREISCKVMNLIHVKSNRQSVSPNCIQLDLKYMHLLFHFHDMFRLQRVIIKCIYLRSN
jgi:hypothetical protein